MHNLGRWLLAQAAATVGGCCVVLHVVTALGPGHGGPLTRAVLLLMAGGCLPCVRGLWRAPTPRVWAMAGVMYAAMLGAHLLVLAPWAAAAGTHHQMAGLTWIELAMWSGVALAVVQLVLVAVVVLGHLAIVPGPAPRPAPESSTSLPWGSGALRRQPETPIT